MMLITAGSRMTDAPCDAQNTSQCMWAELPYKTVRFVSLITLCVCMYVCVCVCVCVCVREREFVCPSHYLSVCM